MSLNSIEFALNIMNQTQDSGIDGCDFITAEGDQGFKSIFSETIGPLMNNQNDNQGSAENGSFDAKPMIQDLMGSQDPEGFSQGSTGTLDGLLRVVSSDGTGSDKRVALLEKLMSIQDPAALAKGKSLDANSLLAELFGDGADEAKELITTLFGAKTPDQESIKDPSSLMMTLFGAKAADQESIKELSSLMGNTTDNSESVMEGSQSMITLLNKLLGGNGTESSDGEISDTLEELLEQLQAGQDAGLSDSGEFMDMAALLGSDAETSEKMTLATDLLEKFLGRQGLNGEVSFEAQRFVEDLISAVEGGNDDIKGADFLNKLKQYFVLAGLDLEKLSINAEGIEALKEILGLAGFSLDEVNDLIAGLKEASNDGEILVSDLMEGLAKLEAVEDVREEDEAGEDLLAASVLPIIQSIMTALGIPESVTGDILSKAEAGEGIHLNSLIAGLQELAKASAGSEVRYKSESGNSGLFINLEQMGIQDAGSSDGRFTLEQLITALEQMRPEKNSSVPAESTIQNVKNGADLESLFNRVLGNIKENTVSAAAVTPANEETRLETSYKMTDSEKSGSLADFFSLQKAVEAGNINASGTGKEAEPEMAQILDRLVSLMNGSGKNTGSIENRGRDDEAVFIKKNKDAVIKGSDLGQPSSGGFKEADINDHLGALKAKSSARALPAYVTNQVGKSLVKTINRGESELKLQLKPPELGRLIMTIDNLGSSLKISVVTENYAAKEILTAHANELKATLAGNGISIESFDVEMNSDFKQAMADARYRPQDDAQGNKNGSDSDSDGLEMDDTTLAGGYQDDDTGLHFVA